MPCLELRSAACVAAAFALLPLDAAAQAPPFMCGPDCSTPGRYVLCEDSFDASGTAAGGIVLQDFLEAGCVSFSAPAAQFDITGFAALFGPGDLVATLLEIFVEEGNPGPGMRLAETGVGIPAAPSAGFTGLFFTTVEATTEFRICLRQQIDDSGGNATGRPLLYDSDGLQGANTTFTPGPGWEASGAPGDFVLRPVVEYDDLAPWEPGGSCDQPGEDAGVAMDSGTPAEDAGTPMEDAGAPADAGDAGATVDAGVEPGGDAGTGNAGPPTITAVSPKEGSNVGAVDITITGTNFESGLSARIGSIQVNEIAVPGSTTILGRVPAGIAPGVYDVIIRNPDDQTAILPEGYTVTTPDGGGAPPAADCGCRVAGARTGTSGGPLLLLIALWFVRRSRR